MTATLTSEFTDFTGEKLFDPENGYFSVKVEPVGTSLLVTSPQFDGKQWTIWGSGASPYFIGQGQLAVYSGNVQAGFAMRPVQYQSLGVFFTPKTAFIQNTSDNTEPTVTAALKGAGDAQQYQSGDGNVYAVDAEVFNGQDITSFVTADATFLAMNAAQGPIQPSPPNGQRKILATVNRNSVQSGSVNQNYYYATVSMNASDIMQGGSYTVANGRSPYIWQLRLELDQSTNGQTVSGGVDISCDVLSCDLNWNATSLNELSHNGTLKVRNNPGRVFGGDYTQYANRANYIQISAWWEGGAGFDPGEGNRQVFYGYTTGATIETKVDLQTVTFKIEDFMACLEGCKFVCSPFYDGMKASLAVKDIVRQLGMADSMILAGNTPISTSTTTADEFGLGAALEPLTEPSFRFKDGSSLKAAIVKTVYFDPQGNFHYDPIAGGIIGNQNTTVVANFFSSARKANVGSEIAWSMVSSSRAINDTYNVLQVKTIDKATGSVMTLADAYNPGMSDPGAEGYLGYRKHLMIMDPVIGSAASLQTYFDTYRNIVFLPPLTVKFETYGHSGIKALDIVTLDGQKLRIMNISYKINPPNEFWMNIEGEWFFSVASDTSTPATAASATATSQATAAANATTAAVDAEDWDPTAVNDVADDSAIE